MRQHFEAQLAMVEPMTLLDIVTLNERLNRRVLGATSAYKKNLQLHSIDRVGRKKLYVVFTKKNPEYTGPILSLADVEIIEDESNPPPVRTSTLMFMEGIWDDEIDKLELTYSFDRMVGDVPFFVEKTI